MPMEARKTVDMVGAPSGSKTGHVWSHVSSCKMEEDILKVNGEQVLNSVAGTYSDMLKERYKGCEYCCLCFRLFPKKSMVDRVYIPQTPRPCKRGRWFAYSKTEIKEFVQKEWEDNGLKALVEEVLANAIQKHGDESVSFYTCEHCSNYMRRVNTLHNGKCTELPMWIALRYIQSGGLTASPCRKMLLHCIQSLVAMFPENPIFQLKHASLVGLREKIELVAHLMNERVADLDEIGCLPIAQWIAEGGQHFFCDGAMSRVVRKQMQDYPSIVNKWQEMVNWQAACRHCIPFLTQETYAKILGSLPDTSRIPSYRSVCVRGSTHPEIEIEKEMCQMEQNEGVLQGCTIFCTLCRRVSTVSYEYHCLLKKGLHAPYKESANEYYTAVLARCAFLQEKKKGM